MLQSLKLRYEKLAATPQELGIPSLLPAPTSQPAPSQTSRRKRKIIGSEPEIRVPDLECNRALPEGVPFRNNLVIEQPERGLFFTDEFGDPAFQRWSDIDQSGIKVMLGFLLMASPIKTTENVRFCQDLRTKIQEHPD